MSEWRDHSRLGQAVQTIAETYGPTFTERSDLGRLSLIADSAEVPRDVISERFAVIGGRRAAPGRMSRFGIGRFAGRAGGRR